MHSLTCVSVVVCVVRKPRPCLSYSRCKDRIISVFWRSYYKGGGGYIRLNPFHPTPPTVNEDTQNIWRVAGALTMLCVRFEARVCFAVVRMHGLV